MEQISFMSILPSAQTLERLNFSTSKMMVLSDNSIVNNIITPEGFEIITSNNEEYDDIAIQSWKNMWIESGCCVDEINTNATHEFIKQARSNYGLQYKTIVAKDILTNKIVGSLSSMFWQGEAPINTNDKNIGTVWGVYVNPLYRRRGIGFAMIQACCIHWRINGCSKGVLIYASEEGKRLYERIGFIPRLSYEQNIDLTSQMIRELKHMLSKEISNDKYYGDLGINFTNEEHLYWIINALPHQLNVILFQDVYLENEVLKKRNHILKSIILIKKKYGTLINPEDNWFTQNIKRLGGGFNMKELATNSQKLASKFDKLSLKYDEWVTINRSKIDNWLVKLARSKLPSNEKKIKCLDIACGIGRPSHTLRLCGLTNAHIIGTDISIGMIEQAKTRRIYNDTLVCDANAGFIDYLPDANFDLIICTGALELLNHDIVIPEIKRLLLPGGKAWLSFQWEYPKISVFEHPTAHQNVYGITIEECYNVLEKAGLVVINIDKCHDAFYTPSGKMTGNMNPVPYLFVEAEVPKSYL